LQTYIIGTTLFALYHSYMFQPLTCHPRVQMILFNSKANKMSYQM